MTAVLLLRLAAPLQAWGTSSRFVRRSTDRVPSRSGIIGLLAAAQGIRRIDPLRDLLQLRIGVRVEQPGHLERDFQTAHTGDGEAMPLSYRFYLADAVFLAAVQGEQAMLEGLSAALRRPAFPLFLGRRSCPPAGLLVHGIHSGGIDHVLGSTPWMASSAVRRRHPEATVNLTVVADCPPDTPGGQLVRDDPVSFDPRHRQYGWRTVHHRQVTVPNPDRRPTAQPVHSNHLTLPEGHDPMGPLESLS